MSAVYTQQGTITATAIVSLEPDRSGNFWCNGVADDVEINAAVTYVIALGGGSVHLGRGAFDITAAIAIFGNLWIYGTGMNSTTLLLSADVNLLEYTDADVVYFFALSEIELHGGDNTGNGLHVAAGGAGSFNDVTLYRVFINHFDGDGIYSEDGWGWRLINIASEFNTGNGAYFTTTDKGLLIIGSKFLSNDARGAYINASAPQITTSEFGGNGTHGLQLVGCLDGSVVNSKFNNNSQAAVNTSNGVQISGSGSRIKIVANNFDGNNQEKYGLLILNAACVNNIVQCNTFVDHVTSPIADLGTNTRLETVPLQFIQGTTFISADGSAKGWEINAEADMAIALGQLPSGVHQVIRIKIWAVALGAPAGAGGQMHLDILFNAGGSLEAWNLAANSWALANFDSEEDDYVNTNVIHWVIEDGDVGNELVNLLGGDSLEVKVNGGTAVAPDGATNATFRFVEVEYV